VWPVVERHEVEGLPVFAAEGASLGFAVATLFFRVGVADETLPRHGTTHLVEHLAAAHGLAASCEIRALVDDVHTRFMATGTPDDVARFLLQVAATLRRLPGDQIERERRVLLTERAQSGPSTQGRLKLLRYGAAGYGLAEYDELALVAPDLAAVQAWADERFTRGNAVALVAGMPASSLAGLGLPEGARIPAPEPRPVRGLRLPAFSEEGEMRIGASFVVGVGPVSLVMKEVLEARLMARLREAEGLVYSVDVLASTMGQDVHVVVATDAQPTAARRALTSVLGVLDDLAEHGPSQEEIARVVDGARRELEHPQAAITEVARAAGNELHGYPVRSPDERLARLAAVTPQDVAQALADALPGLLVKGPAACRPLPPTLPEYEARDDSPLGGRSFPPGRDVGGDGATRIVTGDGGITFHGRGVVYAFRWDEIVAVAARAGERWMVVAEDGYWFEVTPAAHEDGAALAAAVREHVPADRFVPPSAVAARLDAFAGERLERAARVTGGLAALGELLDEDEELRDVASFRAGKRWGALLVTDERVLWAALDPVYDERDEVDEVPRWAIQGARARRGALVLDVDGRGEVRRDGFDRRRAQELAALLAASRG
jgi:predicted Zn-dependent peptidase